MPAVPTGIVDEIKAAGGQAFPITADMTDPVQVQRAVDEAAEGLGLDRRVRRHHRRRPLGEVRDDRAGRLGLDDPEQSQSGPLSVPDRGPEDDRARYRRRHRALASADGINAAAMHAPYGAAKAGVISLAKTSPGVGAATAFGVTPSRRATSDSATRIGRRVNGRSMR